MNKKILLAIIIMALLIMGIVVGVLIYINGIAKNSPEAVLSEFVQYTNEANYAGMYNLLTEDSKVKISQEDFEIRNKNIYDGIDMSNMQLEIKTVEEVDSSNAKILYGIKMNTSCGEVNYSYTANFTKESNKEFKLNWSSNMIFPNLNDYDKVKVSTTSAQRGSILDRNGELLAGEGKVSSVGFVPGKMSANKENDIKQVADLLEVSEDKINNELAKSYVKDDTFVEIKKISSNNQELKNILLQIPGIKISSSKARVYPLGEAAAHLTGYVQNITAEELKENSGKGYTATSMIGKSGLESVYEDRLRGRNGIEIYIVDSTGNKKQTIAKRNVQNGEDIKITIDADLQKRLYEQMKNDNGFFVVMQPVTGEMMALVSTASYNPNEFVLGISSSKWNELKNNPNQPMYNRYLQAWTPGSTFKPVTGAIGLTSGKLSTTDEFYYTGLSWQKDSSWGNYNITTLTPYSESKNLRNAIVRSDNIYFAQATLKIGRDTFTDGLKKLGFNEDIDFLLNTSKSQYSNTDKIETEIQLADSGYGQGQILVNPIHMASIYSAFVNNGNMVKPYLEYKENINIEYLKAGVFTEDGANIIKDYLLQVVESSDGTANDARINGTRIAGKTGTAELKQSKSSEERETLGWFNCFTVDNENPILIISMVENAQINGGSHYLIKKIKTLF